MVSKNSLMFLYLLMICSLFHHINHHSPHLICLGSVPPNIVSKYLIACITVNCAQCLPLLALKNNERHMDRYLPNM